MMLPRKGAKFCTPKCGTYFRRRANSRPTFPVEMTSRDRWIRRSADKVPLTISGSAGSSTNSRTWSSFEAASKSTAGVGMGFILGAGIGCVDLDYCIVGGALTDWAREAIAAIAEPIILTEVSQSGLGVHIFIETPEAPGLVIRDGRNIERYSAGRYIAVTGVKLSM